MDLNQSVALPGPTNLMKHNNLSDTALSLNLSGSTTARADGPNCSDDGCRLVLGLGPTPTSYNYYFGVNKTKASVFTHALSSGDDSVLQLGLPAESSNTYGGLDSSLSAYTEMTGSFLNQVAGDSNGGRVVPIADEGSTSAKRSGGYMASLLLLPPRTDNDRVGTDAHSYNSETSSQMEFSVGANSDKMMIGSSSHQRTSIQKKCRFLGCSKGARGASGLCIGHGGGQRCQKPGCNKGAESKTTFCKAHGGGRRCQHLGCTKSAEGKTDFCIAHGGGRRCGFIGGCTRAARGKSGLCIRHGGGKRCKIEGCTRSAEGQAGLCISHGGGRRCQYPECNKGAQGSTNYCKAHGGGKRCIFVGCTKGAEGSTPLCKAHGGGKRCLFDGGGICPKSVHGGTDYCVAHGGGKRCAVVGCTKSARGRTDCCVKHGGGKRCKSEGCEKSAQGSTDYCKAHGGGKRCSWGDGKCDKFARGKSGLCAAHNTLSMEKGMTTRCLIGPGLFRGLVPASTATTDNSQSGISDCIDSFERSHPEKRQKKLIPMQVLVPPSLKSPLETPEVATDYSSRVKGGGRSFFDFTIPEERVHGGGLMCLLGGSLKHPIDGI